MSWLSSNLIKGRVRERRIITISGIAPDIDGVGLLIDPILRMAGHSSNLWGEWHHSLHNLGFCLFVTCIAYITASINKFKVACMAFLLFHLHLVCDLIGSKGPDGYQWPLSYLSPFSEVVTLSWKYQWELNAWPNIAIALVLYLVMFRCIKYKKRSPFEIMSKKADDAFFRIFDRFK
ncbi:MULTISPECIES: hypothetical protein [Pseudoalteromonas]|nr:MULTISPECIES: hypothetical protein [Pseudoalteromonas]